MLSSLLKEIDASPKNVKQFAWLFAIIGMIIIPGIIWYKHDGLVGETGFISFGIGSLFLLIGLIRYQILNPIYKAWMLLALVLGLVMTKVIITIVYYLVMTPIGLVKRRDLNKSMHLKFVKNEESYWIKKQDNTDPKRLERLF
jgi:membrane-bound ClpP family serine protease